jgi:hypothetical protein
MALFAFRSEATLAGVAVGLNLVNTAFFSPSIMLTDLLVAGMESDASEGDIYIGYVGLHVIVLVVGIILSFTKK